MTFFGQDNVEFHDTLPKTMVGKVMRCELVGDETGRRTQ
jgi:acyl-coenzyme A synthetase/AMP-(fatty) acid ligase